MASLGHEFIVKCLVMKMRELGIEIIAFDGDWRKISTIKLKTPPIIKRHRPDVLGLHYHSNELCIGEAKTQNDLHSERTKEQLVDFSSIDNCIFIIGIPKTAEMALLNLLGDLRIALSSSVQYIKISEDLYPEI